MMPGPVAAGIYASIKIAGYAAFASGINKAVARNIPPLEFGVAKTVIGLVGGITYLFAIVPQIGRDASGMEIWAWAIPIRVLAWAVVLAYFYGFRQRPALIALAIPVGVAWSYCLDWFMSFLYRLFPGLAMPFC